MSNKISLKRGLDISISGCASQKVVDVALGSEFSVLPAHYHGLTPKVVVHEGDIVKAGDALFHDKKFESLNVVSPVSGVVKAVVRGERRKVLSINITADVQQDYKTFDTALDVKTLLLQSGLWSLLRQRPYDVIADPCKDIRDVFVSAFDSAPLAPDYNFTLQGQQKELQAGFDALAKLTGKKVHLSVSARHEQSTFNNMNNVEYHTFDGPHPAGNVSVQINHIAPVNKGETVVVVNIADVALIGRLMLTGKVDMHRVIALTGPEVKNPQYYNYISGAALDNIVKDNVSTDKPLRCIAGNVLSGQKLDQGETLSPFAYQISVIDDGSETHEILGWAMPRIHKFSTTRLFLAPLTNFISKTFHYDWDARVLGGRRAIIMSGEYDKMLPMDIYAEYLIKAMIAGNIDKMEALGAYEVAPEDFALAEFACTSKMPLQAIVRQALDNMRKELE
ncbi:MAG TPA: NADH:ubiquinone reductase (Na(+)-transporting) subunit A [Bacteroidales bacterium]|nr:NADH:ubiquinone reductase (Na(+)-transporting) subunit A [Bacteroidales bacterium]